MYIESAPTFEPTQQVSDLDLALALNRYAELLLIQSAGLIRGDSVLVVGENCHQPFGERLKEVGARNGISVNFAFTDPRAIEESVRSGNLQQVCAVVEPLRELYDEAATNRSTVLKLAGYGDPDRYNRLARECGEIYPYYLKALDAVRSGVTKLIKSKEIVALLAADATVGLAQQCYVSDGLSDKEALRALQWEICRRTLTDSDQAFSQANNVVNRLDALTRVLNALQVQNVHITALDTDIHIGFPPETLFGSVIARTPTGRRYASNVPSYESYRPPDYRTVSGHVSVKAPFYCDGIRFDPPLCFTYEGGNLVDITGDVKNRDLLTSHLKRRGNSNAWVGEVAITLPETPTTCRHIGITVLDEQEGPHLGVGAADPRHVTIPIEHWERAGICAAEGHFDFVIWDPTLSMKLTTRRGEKVLVYKDGAMVLDLAA